MLESVRVRVKVRPVVGDVSGEGIAAVQIDGGAGEVDGGNCGHGAVSIESGRVRSFAHVVEEIELDGNAVRNARISQPSAVTAKRSGPGILDDKGEAVGLRVRPAGS